MSRPVDALAPLGRLIKLPLYAMVFLVAALSAAALLSVDTLRGHVERWDWTDHVADTQAELQRLLTDHANNPEVTTEADILARFDALDDAIRNSAADAGLARALLVETSAARGAFLIDESQRTAAQTQLLQVRQTADGVDRSIADELAATRRAEVTSDLASRRQEEAQRRRVKRVMQIADHTIAAQRLRTQLNTLLSFPSVASSDAVFDTAGLPADCLTDTPSVPELCTPSPARVFATIRIVNAASERDAKLDTARDALWAVGGYLRGLRRVFEEESRSLTTSVDALEAERSVKRAVSIRRTGLTRLARVVRDIREHVDALPMVTPQEIDGLNNVMNAYLNQLRQRGRGLFSVESVGQGQADTFDRAVSALKSAWGRAVEAMAARHVSSRQMETALDRMNRRVVREAGRVQSDASSWIDTFSSTTVLALSLFGLIIGLGAMLANRLIAMPIARINQLILRLAEGEDNEPIDARDGGRSLRPLFMALETLRQSSVSRRTAELKSTLAARDLKRAHDRLSGIANSAPAGLYELKMYPDGRMELPYRSWKFDRLLAVGGDDDGERQSAERAFSRVHPDDAQTLFETLSASARTLEPMQLRHRVEHPSRGTIWVTNASFPVSDQDGIVHWAGTVTDVTEEVRYEAELEAARVKAEAANQAKSQFLANMSHEIRTPMNGIIGMCDLLKFTEMTSEQRSCMETINSSAENLLTLIGDVLDLAKVEAGKLEASRESFSLRALVYEIGGFFGPSLREKRLEFCIDHDDRIGRRKGDPGKIRQILINLLGNAIKFTDRGHIAVVVRAGEGDDVAISVRDTGVGIAAEDLEEVFEPFRQADNTFTRAHDGTGLGLAIARRLATLMDGEITLASTPGEGSDFTLRLPLDIDRAAPGEVPEPQLAGRTVLVVEPFDLTRDVLATQVTALGAHAILADCGTSALQALASARSPIGIDLALIGHDLPDWDASALATAIAREARQPVPCLLHAPVDRALQHGTHQIEGFVGSLIRPSPTSDLAAIALTALSRCAPASQAGKPEERRSGTGGAFTGLKVMAAEDNRTNQVILKKVMASLSVELEIFDNGLAVSEAYESFGADVIFMDISMPVMDGLDATRRIRAHEAMTGQAPCFIVALTAHVSPEDRTNCFDAGMDKFLTKPIRRALIEAALEGAVARFEGNDGPKLYAEG